MSDSKTDRELDELETNLKNKELDKNKVTYGQSAREERRRKRIDAEKKQISICLDQDIIEQFKSISGGKGYQSIMNQALREWLVARDIKGLLAGELQELAERLCLQVTTKVEEKLVSQKHSLLSSKLEAQ